MRWGTGRSSSGGKNQSALTKSSTWGKFLASAEALSDVAVGILQARGRLRPVDLLALGMKSVQAGMKLYETWSTPAPVDLWAFFREDPDWQLCSSYVCHIAFEGIEFQEKISETHRVVIGGKIVAAAMTAVIDGVEIGFCEPVDLATVPSSIVSKTPHLIRNIAARRLWEKAGSDNIIRIVGERAMPFHLPEAVIETKFLRALRERADAFLRAGLPRAFVMDGEPGTGKTTAVGHIAKSLGFRTAIIDASDFCKAVDTGGMGSSDARGAELAEILRPDVLIVNDIDWVPKEKQLQLLSLLDNVKSYARLIYATTNHYRALMEPVRRPGRLDDLIPVPGLSVQEIAAVAPSCGPVAHRMVGWPIAYVRDMEDRFKVLGDRAFEEVGLLEGRLKEVREDGKYHRQLEQAKVNGMQSMGVWPHPHLHPAAQDLPSPNDFLIEEVLDDKAKF